MGAAMLLTVLVAASAGCTSYARQHEARVEQTHESAVQIRQLAREYVRFKGVCPADVDEFTEIGIRSRRGFVDPWGEKFVILCDANDPDAIEVRSIGPDCTANTEDDISSNAPVDDR
jgi:hypothetical protein